MASLLLSFGSMTDDADRKTEPPSKHKLQRARRKGQVAVSRELAASCGMLAACAVMVLGGGQAVEALSALARRCWQGGDVHLWQAALSGLTREVGMVGAAAGLAALVVLALQCGLRLRLRADLARLHPVRGLKKMFGRQRLADLLVMLVKLGALLGAGAFALAWLLPDVLSCARAGAGRAAAAAAALLLRFAGTLLLVSLAAAVLDWWIQRRRHLKKMRMTRREVQDEHKEQEGDPRQRSERRRIHRQVLAGAGVGGLHRARVVVVNPVHVAVALAYRHGEDQAPWVLVSGTGAAARRIRVAAMRLDVPVVQQVTLARALRLVEPGDEIPENLYHATAEVIRSLEEPGM